MEEDGVGVRVGGVGMRVRVGEGGWGGGEGV